MMAAAPPQPPPRGSILARTARGAGWVVAWRLATRLLGLASTLVLVRLLLPADFGLVALATAFATSLEVCLTLGVEDQIIRAPAPDRTLYDSAFTINLLRGLLIGGLVALAAAPAAAFFGDARLEPVLLALALSAVASGLLNIGVTDFRRDLQFQREFALQLGPRLAGIATTLGLACLLQSHWALVAGILVNRAGLVVGSYALHPFRPRLSLAAWRDLIGVSGWSWALSVATVLRDRTDSLAIGRVLGPIAVGQYSVGVEMAALPTSELVDPICRACMPGFAASHRENAAAGGADYLRILALLALPTLPAGLGISLVAGPVVALAYGQAWVDAVPVVAVLGVTGILTLFGNVSAAMLNARTRLPALLGVTLLAAALRLALLLALLPPFGLVGAALAVGGAILAEHLLLMQRALVLLHVPLRALLAVLWRPAVAAASMALLLWQAGLGWAPPPTASGPAARLLLAGVALGVAGYAVALVALWALAGRPRGAETDILDMLRRLARHAWPTLAARRPA